MTRFKYGECTLEEFDKLVHLALANSTAEGRYSARKGTIMVVIEDSLRRSNYVIGDMIIKGDNLVIEITPEF